MVRAAQSPVDSKVSLFALRGAWGLSCVIRWVVLAGSALLTVDGDGGGGADAAEGVLLVAVLPCSGWLAVDLLPEDT